MADSFDNLSDEELMRIAGVSSGARPTPGPTYSADPGFDYLDSAPQANGTVSIEPVGSNNQVHPFERLSNEELMQIAGGGGGSSPGGVMGAIEGGSSAMLRGAAFNWGNEIQAGDSALRNYIATQFANLGIGSGGNGQDFATNYATKRDTLAAQDAAFSDENPKTAFGLNVAGALLPALLTAGASTPAAATTLGSRGAVGRIISDLFGVGLPKAPGALRLAEMGALGGAVAGAGEGVGTERVGNSVVGALLGSILNPAIAKGVGYVGQGAMNLTAPLRSRISLGSETPLAAEAGAIPMKIAEGYTPAEMVVANRLKSVPVEKVLKAAEEISQTSEAGNPLFLPEAVDSASINRHARFITNYEPSMEYANNAINSRSSVENVASRTNMLLDDLSPEASTFEGASRMSEAADSIITKAETDRADVAAPMYGEAYRQRPFVIDPDLDELLAKDKHLASIIKNVKKTANNADLPDNATPVLMKARQELDDDIRSAQNLGNTRKAVDLGDTRKRLDKILKNDPHLRAADEFYSSSSGAIEELNSTFLKSLSKMTTDKVQNVAQVFNLSPERITQLRGLFDERGKLPEWNAGIRSYIQRAYEEAGDGVNFASKLRGTPAGRTKLEAALGDKYEAIAKGLDYENRYFKGRNVYNPNNTGAQTQGMQAETVDHKTVMGFFENIKNKEYIQALSKIFTTDLDGETAKQIAKIYFDPKTGATSLKKVIPLLEEYARGERFGQILAKSTERSARTAVAEQTPKINQSEKPRVPNDIKVSPSPKAATAAKSKVQKLNDDLFGKKEDPSIKKIVDTIDSEPFDSAVFQIESTRGKNLSNPKSSAKGAFQLIDSTANALGVGDVMDLSQNYQGFLKLKQENISRFKTEDPYVLYAAHFLGAPTLDAWYKGKLTPDQAEHVREFDKIVLPRFKKIYNKLVVNQVEA